VLKLVDSTTQKTGASISAIGNLVFDRNLASKQRFCDIHKFKDKGMMLSQNSPTNEPNRKPKMQKQESIFSGFSNMYNELEVPSDGIFSGLSQFYSDMEGSTILQESHMPTSKAECDDDDIAANMSLNGARGFASKSGINHENSSSQEKTIRDFSQEANSKIEDMQETMKILIKSPLLWAKFKSRLSTSNVCNGIVAVQTILQEFVDDHPEIKTMLLALKRKKKAMSRQESQPRLSTGFMETVNNSASVARRISVDVSSQLSSIMLGDGRSEIKGVSNRLSLPSRRRLTTHPSRKSIASHEVERIISAKEEDETATRKELMDIDSKSQRNLLSQHQSSMMTRDGVENEKIFSRLSLPSRSRSKTFPSRASLIIAPETKMGHMQRQESFSVTPSNMNTLLEIDEEGND